MNHPRNRREFLRLGAAASALMLMPGAQPRASAVVGSHEEKAFPLARFPEKAEMILLTDRPPQLETPLKIFRKDITPNESFFVRWHLSGIPTSVDTQTFRLSVGGHVNTALQLSLDDLKNQFEPVS